MLINYILQPCEDRISTYTRHTEIKDLSPIINLLAVNILFEDPLGWVTSFLLICEDIATLLAVCLVHCCSIRINRSVRASVQRLMGLPQHVRSCGASSLFSSVGWVGLSWMRSSRRLRHDSEYGVVAADARPDLFIIFLSVAHLVKLRLWRTETILYFSLCFKNKNISKKFKVWQNFGSLLFLSDQFCSSVNSATNIHKFLSTTTYWYQNHI